MEAIYMKTRIDMGPKFSRILKNMNSAEKTGLHGCFKKVLFPFNIKTHQQIC